MKKPRAHVRDIAPRACAEIIPPRHSSLLQKALAGHHASAVRWLEQNPHAALDLRVAVFRACAAKPSMTVTMR
jgi:hypothetical protein